jgi:parallel beta-helix repeat protein
MRLKYKELMKDHKKPILAFLLSSIIFISLIATSFLMREGSQFIEDDDSGDGNKDDDIRIVQSINPIFINDLDPIKNWSKTADDNSWCSGSGNWGDPYIIENVTIDGGMVGSGITIQNSNKSYFILKNVTIFNCGGGFDNEAGIKLENCNNGTIMNSNCSFTRRNGILLIDSHNNTIFNNTIRNNINNQNDGIQLEYSNNNTISNNLVKNNGFNTITKDSGIKLINSNNTIIRDNDVRENIIFSGIYIENSINNTIYHNNLTDNNADGLTLLNSNNNTIERNIINENDLNGIEFTNSKWNKVEENKIKDNEGLTNENGGIKLLSDSNNNWIQYNNITDNQKCGFIISSGKSNSIIHNRFINNVFRNAVDEDINNIWDNGSIGNYWSDYPYVDGNDDGIGDKPYNIDGFGNAKDNFPEWEDGEHMPKPFILSTNANEPDINGIFNLTWTESINAVNYSIYSYYSNITEINGSVSLLFDDITEVYHQIDDFEDGKTYFILRAFNQYNFSILSNCININVTKYPRAFILFTNANEPDIDGGFNLTWTESLFSNNYTVYQYHKNITEINGSLIILSNEITELYFELLDVDNGTYFFIVVAFNNFANISSNCIVVNINRSLQSYSLTSNADVPDSNGLFDLIWTESLNADNYSIYEYNTFITEINDSLTIIEEQVDVLFYNLSKDDGVYYYIVIAYNELGNLSSNCIQIVVDKYLHSFLLDDDDDDPDDDGDFSLSWTESINANNYSVYEYNSFIMEFNDSLSLISGSFEELFFDFINKDDGDYYYIIIAFNNFGNISSNCIEVIVDKLPQPFILQSDALSPDYDGVFYISWTDSLNADNYTLYQFGLYITEINDSLIIVREETISKLVKMELDEGEYFFIVVAFNEFGDINSNIINITIEEFIYNGGNEDDDADNGSEMPSFDIGVAIFWIATIGLIVIGIIIYVRRRRKYWDIKWKRKRK